MFDGDPSNILDLWRWSSHLVSLVLGTFQVVLMSPSPGRFFAALEMKFLMAYLLIHYDVRMDGDETRPTSNPAHDATVLFRRRSVTI